MKEFKAAMAEYLASENITPEVFHRRIIQIQFTPHTAATWEGQVVCYTLVDLVSRLFQGLRLEIPDVPCLFRWGKDRTLKAVLEERYHVATGFKDEPPLGLDAPVLTIQIGEGEGKADFYVSSSQWKAIISPTPILNSLIHSEILPTGAVAAACLTAIELVKKVLGKGSLDSHYIFSTFDPSQMLDENPVVSSLPLGEVILAGAGSIGTGFLYTLLFSDAASGKILLLDGDPKLDARNYLRYVLPTRQDIECFSSVSKVDWAKGRLADYGFPLEVEVVPRDFDPAMRDTEDELDLVISAVDRNDSRHDIAYYRPRRVINAATGSTTITLTTHGQDKELACLACHFSDDTKKWQGLIQDIAGIFGLSVERVTELLGNSSLRTTEEDYQVMIAAGCAEPNCPNDYIGLNRDGLRKHERMYAKISLPEQFGGTDVTLPFVPLLAGCLQAAETLKHRLDLKPNPYNYLRFDVMDIKTCIHPRRKKVSPKCLVCNDHGESNFILEDELKLTGI